MSQALAERPREMAGFRRGGAAVGWFGGDSSQASEDCLRRFISEWYQVLNATLLV